MSDGFIIQRYTKQAMQTLMSMIYWAYQPTGNSINGYRKIYLVDTAMASYSKHLYFSVILSN